MTVYRIAQSRALSQENRLRFSIPIRIMRSPKHGGQHANADPCRRVHCYQKPAAAQPDLAPAPAGGDAAGFQAG